MNEIDDGIDFSLMESVPQILWNDTSEMILKIRTPAPSNMIT